MTEDCPLLRQRLATINPDDHLIGVPRARTSGVLGLIFLIVLHSQFARWNQYYSDSVTRSETD